MADRRDRRALRGAAQDLRATARPLKGTDHPALPALRTAASLLGKTDDSVTEAKRTLIGLDVGIHLSGILSMINAHAIREGLDPFEGMTSPREDQRERPRGEA